MYTYFWQTLINVVMNDKNYMIGNIKEENGEEIILLD
jgi:hypothetical protein